MDSLTETTALVSTLVASAAMVVLGLRKRLLVHARPPCPACAARAPHLSLPPLAARQRGL